jgi:hypothetical protein
MARAFRPNVCYDVDYDHKQFEVPTYAEAKRNMKDYLNEANGEVTIYRHRRGEWGEWFEKWEFNYKRKPIIVKEGWM